MGEEEQKTPKSDQEQVGGAAKGAVDAGGKVLDAGKSAVDTGKKAVQGARKIADGAKKTAETAQKAVKMARKAVQTAVRAARLVAHMIHALVSAIAALFNPVTWIVLGIILVIVIIVVAYAWLTDGFDYENVQGSFRETFEGNYARFGEDEATTVSGEFGKRFNFSQIDIEGPAELSMSSSGCGPTAIAMALSELANQEISPIEVAQFGLANGTYTVADGTYYDLYTSVVTEFSSKYPSLANLKMTQSNSKEDAIKALQSGAQIVCNSGSYFPVGSGHVICICGYENGSFLIKDPNTTEAQAAKHTSHQTKEPLDVGGYKIWYLDENFVHENVANYFIYTV